MVAGRLKIVATTLGIGFLGLLFAVAVIMFWGERAHKLPGERGGGICSDVPQFSEYPAVPLRAIATSSTLDFSLFPKAENFKTAIAEWFAEGPQSGRYYTVAEWGCGSGCQAHAIVDMRNGKITGYGLLGTDGTMYRPDSNLIIINPPWNIEASIMRPATVTSEFYELKDGVPVLICKKPYPPIHQ